jgi:hypothetical protein
MKENKTIVNPLSLVGGMAFFLATLWPWSSGHSPSTVFVGLIVVWAVSLVAMKVFASEEV